MPDKNIRIWGRTYKRLKDKAHKRRITLKQLIDELSIAKRPA